MARGRRTKLTPEVQNRIVAAMKAGNYMEAVCNFAGIGTSTFYRWMERGEKAKSGRYREFWEAVKKAEAEAEVRMVAQWQAHMPENWQAIATFLERRYPDRWGRRKLDVDMKRSGDIEVEIVLMDDEDGQEAEA